ncbi:hypothetical protein IJT93_08025 [bacterium]|nr:hypothetical protein [bacterium]
MSEAKVSWQPSSKLEIRYTGNIHGDLETLPYTATVIKQQRAAHPDLLLFDTGSFSGPNAPGNIQGDPHVKVYNHLKYDAVVPGRAEAMDTNALKRMARAADFPFIATNWRGMGEGDFFVNQKVIKRENDTLVVLGMACDYTPKDTESVAPEAALDEALKDFDPADTVVIILSQLDGNQNLSLAKRGKFTKVIICGIPVPGVDQTMQVGNSLLVPAASGPKQLGSVSVDLSGAIKMPKK